MCPSPVCAKRFEISGVVQGVGFRPFLFGLAKAYRLCGRVSNTAKGVDLVLEGPEADIGALVRDIPLKKPLLSRITAMAESQVAVSGYKGFSIVKSRASDARSTLISPDVSICPDCLAEMQDPGNRRFGYPFINCTNCGPRYTIIRDVPYDRPKTSMKAFTMCPACQAEYEDPMDRRFHAQPNACPVCGPQVFLTDNTGRRLDQTPDQAVQTAADLLGQGRILAIKGLGGFHLACDAKNETSVQLLRQRKRRPDKPFALMAADAGTLMDHVRMDEAENRLLTAFNRPIVLLEKQDVNSHAGLAPSLAPNNTCLGIMLPYTPLHYLLLDRGPDILVMTSGNRSKEPLAIDNADALDAFGHIADFFLFHDRDIYFRADDSITRIQQGRPRFVRRSRGYAPLPIDLSPFSDQGFPGILGCGAGLKSTICLTRDRYGFLSQHIGDLENPKVHDFYGQTIRHMEKILDIKPMAAAHDLHPGYYSTQYAKALGEQGMALVPVQHHHAHALACMAENRLSGPVIGLTLDGTGLGTDGHIWGGEVLVCDYLGFDRRVRLAYIPMPGGDAAVSEPWRMAASVLYTALGASFLDLDIPYIRDMGREGRKKLAFLVRMMEKKVNTPLTSSAGRLFDAVSSLLGICHNISHESQAAMELEAVAADVARAAPYPYDTAPDDIAPDDTAPDGTLAGQTGGCRILDLMPAVRSMVADIRDRQPVSLISARFHETLARAFAHAVIQTCNDTGICQVVLSGGVFNNNRILLRVMDYLARKGLEVYTHTQVPWGDGGIALGQVMAAAARMHSDPAGPVNPKKP